MTTEQAKLDILCAVGRIRRIWAEYQRRDEFRSDLMERLATCDAPRLEALSGQLDAILQSAADAEGQRILGRIRDAQASWEKRRTLDPHDPCVGIAIATLEVVSTCITHKGVTREQALAEAREKMAAYKAQQADRPVFVGPPGEES